MMRPSALPMMAECPKFEGAPSEDAAKGIVRHKAIAAFLKGDEKALEAFGEDEEDNLVWAADYIKLKAPLLDFPLIIERQRQGVLPNGVPIQGTPDFVCGPVLLDLKWRPRVYDAQMAAYALMIMADGFAPPITAHLLFAATQTVRVLTFDANSAWGIIKPILDMVDAPFAVATPCTFCGWCKKKLTCEALIQQVNIALQSNPEWNLPQWHSSKMETAEEIGQALRIARTLGDWCESVEFHAKQLAIKQGILAKGYTLTTRKGNRYVSDVVQAFQRLDLPQPEFLKTCSVNLKSLFGAYTEFHKIKKAAAEREVTSRLGDAIQNKETVTYLTEEKPSKD